MAYPVRYFCCRSISDEEMERVFHEKNNFLSMIRQYAGPVRGETGVPGLRLDFNDGLRLEVPEGAFHVRITHADVGTVFFDEDVSGVLLQSKEKFFVPWQIDVSLAGHPVFSHTFDPTGQPVLVIIGTKALGDMLVALPYLRALRERRQAVVTCYVAEYLRGFVRRLLPEVTICDTWPEEVYATFFLGAVIDAPSFSPIDGRLMRLEEWGRVILGIAPLKTPPAWSAKARTIEEPYVCIGVQASDPAKGWRYPGAWDTVVAALRTAGYRVLCIDRDREGTGHGFTTRMPAGAEDFTGDHPIEERADLLAHAAFFIGLSSGLSWLAHVVGCPVVMICGFSESWFEFDTPYRVYNPLACHGCLDDVSENYFDNPCPRQPRGSDRILECQKTITPGMVLEAIHRLQQDEARALS